MAKSGTVFVCRVCGFEAPRWQGRCPSCQEWNSFEEHRIAVRVPRHGGAGAPGSRPVTLADVEVPNVVRGQSGFAELDSVLGGGFVPGSLVLLGGEPGIGKSTLALQVSLARFESVLYVSGEESAAQVKLRAERVGPKSRLKVLAETDVDAVLEAVLQERPELVVVDSVQTMYSQEVAGVSGGVAQVTGAVQKILSLAKSLHVTFLLIGHVTKDGYLAGPKTLEHMVDTVLYLEGERFASFRLLRCVKNRFGPTNEVGVFEMAGEGMREVSNPSELFLEQSGVDASGNVVTAVLEGSRALLLEVQALTSSSSFGYPKRTAAGFDPNRLQLIVAILTKRAQVNLSAHDLYVNVVGGVKVTEPAADLAVALAVASSLKEQVVKQTLVLGELGLSGEVRAVPNLEKRLKEAGKLGFTRAICPLQKNLPKVKNLELVLVRTLKEAMAAL